MWIEVGYGLEEFITDGFAGETSREVMTPEFRQGDYGAGLLAGTDAARRPDRARAATSTLDGVPRAAPLRPRAAAAASALARSSCSSSSS